MIVSKNFHYESTQWEIVSKSGVLNENEYSCCIGEVYQDIVFKIGLRRYRFAPTVAVLIPILIIALLAILTFFVPPGRV